MQVATVQDHITHAVMGANTAQSFGISDSPEFFNILSNSLYSNKKQAVVREVLCNGWDSHIDSGKVDLPLRVTLTDQALTIQDFGAGIPDSAMHTIYCVYGLSTKLNDGKQTGGFGLGCKAPFAYTDHFEVTSCHAGMKTIYRISKSSGEVGGRPGLMKIASVPTTETGLQVKIELKDSYDKHEFDKLIRFLTSSGEILVNLNEELLPVLPFSKAVDGYLITDSLAQQFGVNQVLVRYGNVIYPVPENSNYGHLLKYATQLIGKLPQECYMGWRLILMAKPNTISITPSRETLSMTDMTVDTLTSLLQAFKDQAEANLRVEYTKINKDCVEKTFRQLNPSKLLNPAKQIVGLGKHMMAGKNYTNFPSISRGIASAHYPDGDFRTKDLELRLTSLIESSYGNRGKIQSYLSALRRGKKEEQEEWFLRRMVSPLVQKLKAQEGMYDTSLLIYGEDQGHLAYEMGRRRHSYDRVNFYKAVGYQKHYFDDFMPFLRNFIILAYNRDDVETRAPLFPEMKFWFGEVRESFVYVVQRSDPKVEQAREFFKSQGFYVVDLTKRLKSEPIPEKVKKDPRPVVKRFKGIPKLTTVLVPGKQHLDTTLFKNAGEDDRIESPEYYIRLSPLNECRYLPTFNIPTSVAIIRKYGDKGGVVINQSQIDKYCTLGAIPLNDWLIKRVTADIMASTTITASLPHCNTLIHRSADIPLMSHDGETLLTLILRDSVLRTYYGLSNTMTDDDRDLLAIWGALKQQYRYIRGASPLDPLTKHIEGSKPSPELLKLVNRLKKATVMTAVLYASTMETRLADNKTPETLKTKIRDMVIFAIKD